MKRELVVGLMALTIAHLTRADATVQQAQESLKEQGYYYGQVTGEKNADTTAAIRRFQIRNGLQVTGELNKETLQALNSGANSSAQVTTATPAPRIAQQDQGTQQRDAAAPTAPPAQAPPGPFAARAPQNYAQPYPPAPQPARSNVFVSTPYEIAPPRLQQQILLGVQSNLKRRGLYAGPVDGGFTPQLELSLRAYQSRIGLPPSGRPDMGTLASLGLLPGQRGAQFPARRFVPRSNEPPVVGEWIH